VKAKLLSKYVGDIILIWTHQLEDVRGEIQKEENSL
jgi:hypothetical protein